MRDLLITKTNQMKKTFLNGFSIVTLIFTFSSCATIFSGSTQTVSFDSNPPGAEVITVRKNGDEQKIGLTPCSVPINKKTKSVKFIKSDFYEETYPLSQDLKLNAWYFVDLAGCLTLVGIPSTIIDMSTGAYYKLPSQVKVELKKK